MNTKRFGAIVLFLVSAVLLMHDVQAEAPLQVCIAAELNKAGIAHGLTGITKDIYTIATAGLANTVCTNDVQAGAEAASVIARVAAKPQSAWYFAHSTAAGVVSLTNVNNFAAMSPSLSKLDNLFGINGVVVGIASDSINDANYLDAVRGVLSPQAAAKAQAQTQTKHAHAGFPAGAFIEATVSAKDAALKQVLGALQLADARLRLVIPKEATSLKQAKVFLVSRDKKPITLSLASLAKSMNIQLPTGGIADTVTQASLTITTTDLSVNDDGSVRCSVIGSGTIAGKTLSAVITSTVAGGKVISFGIAIKPSSTDGFGLSKIYNKLSKVDAQLQMQNISFVITNGAISDPAFLTFAAATPQDIQLIKKVLKPVEQEPEYVFDDSLFDDTTADTDTSETLSSDELDAFAIEDDTTASAETTQQPVSSEPAELVSLQPQMQEVAIVKTLQANAKAALSSLQPGLTIITDVQAKSGSLTAQSLEGIGVQSMRLIIYIPKDFNFGAVTKAELKKLQVRAFFLQEAAVGICLAKGLLPLLQSAGVSADSVKPITDILQLVCFSTQSGLLLNEQGDFTFYIDGPLKKGGKRAMLKVTPGDKIVAGAAVQLTDTSFTFGSLRKELGLLDSLFGLQNITVGVSTYGKANFFDIKDQKVDLTLADSIKDIAKGGFVEADITAKVDGVKQLLSLLQLQQARLLVQVPFTPKSPRDVKIQLLSRTKNKITLSVDDLLQKASISLPSGGIANALKGLTLTVEDTDFALAGAGLRVRLLGSVSFMQKTVQALVTATVSTKGLSDVAIVLKPSSTDGINFATIASQLSIVDQQVQLNALSLVLAQGPVTDASFLQFAAATPADIALIKRELVPAPPAEEEYVFDDSLFEDETSAEDQSSFDVLDGLDDANEQPAESTISTDTTSAQQTTSTQPAMVERITTKTLIANMKAALSQLEPGLTVVADVGATSGGLLADSLQAIGLQTMRLIMYVPKDVKLANLSDKNELKKIVVRAVFMQEPPQGLCFARGLAPLIQAVGFTNEAQSLNEILSLVCFGTDIGLSFDEDLHPLFFISGPLKKGGVKAMVKVRLADKKYITVAWQGVARGFKLASLRPELADFDKLLAINNLTVVASNDTAVSAFDIQNNKIDATAPGALLNLGTGLTLFADVQVTDTTVARLLATAGLDSTKLQIHIPQGAKTAADISVSFASQPDAAGKKVCVGDVMPATAIPSNALTAALSSACTSGGRTSVSFSGGSLTLGYQSTVSLQGKVVPFELRAVKAMGASAQKPVYAVVAMPADGFTFATLSTNLQILDTQMKLKNVKVAIANEKIDTAIGGLKSLEAGLTLTAEADFIGLVGNVAEEIEIKDVQIVYHLPLGAKSFKDGVVQIKPESESGDGLCVAKPVSDILALMNIQVAKGVTDILKSVCFNTTIGLTQKDDDFTFFIGGRLKEPTLQALMKVSSKVVKQDNGLPKTDSSEFKKTRFALGVQYGKPLTLAQIDSSLAFLDAQITLSNPIIMAANYDGATLFDIDAPDLPDELQQPVANIDKGITLRSDATLKGDAGSVAGLINAKNLRLTVYIPINSTKNSDIKVRLEQVPGKDDEQTVCLSKLAGDLPGIALFAQALGATGDVCITKKSLAIMPDAEGLTVQVNGSLAVAGKALNATMFVRTAKGKNAQVALAAAASGDLTFGGSLAPAAMFTSLATFSKPIFMISNFKEPQKLLGADPSGKQAEFTVQPGLSIQANMQLDGIYAEPVKFFGINDFDAIIAIPVDPKNLEGYYVKASKEIDRSVEALNLKKFSLSIRGGTPPVIALDVDTLANLGNLKPTGITTTDGKVALTLGVEFGEAAFALTGKLACEGAQCPTIQPLPSLPLILESTKDVPLSIKLNFVGGAAAGMGGSGNLKFGNDYITTLFDSNPGAKKYAAQGNFNKLCLVDMVDFAQLFVKNLGIPKIQLPNIVCLNNVNFSVNPSGATAVVAGNVIETGFDIHGTTNLLGATGKLDVHVKSPDLVGVLTSPDEIGIDASGSLSPINLGPLFSMTSAKDKTQGPSVSMALTKAKQEIGLSGNLSLVSGLINAQSIVKIDVTGVNASFNQTFAGLNMAMSLQGATNDLIAGKLDNFKLTGKVTNDLSSTINAAVEDAIGTVLSTAMSGQQALADACQKALGYLKVFNFDCSKCIGSATGLAVTSELIQSVVKAAQVSLDGISVVTNLSSISQAQLPGVMVNLTLFGKKRVIGPVVLDLKNPNSTLQKVVADALKLIITPADVLAETAKNVASTVKMECSTSINLGASSVTAKAYISATEPLSSYVTATVPKMSLLDLVAVSENAISAAMNKNIKLSLQSDAIGNPTLQNVTFTFNPSSIAIDGQILLFGLPPAAISGSINGDGLYLSGALAPLNVPGAIALINPADTAQGPLLSIAITPTNPSAVLNGNLRLLTIAQSKVNMSLSASPEILTNVSLLGLQGQAKISGFTLDSFNPSTAVLTISLDASSLTGAVSSAIKSAQAIINKPLNEVQSALNAINSKCGEIPLSCLACSVTDVAKTTLKNAQAVANAPLNKIAGFSINGITLSGPITGFSFVDGAITVPSIGIDYSIDGSKQHLDLKIQKMSSFDTLMAAIMQQLFNPVGVAQNVSAAASQLLDGTLWKQAAADVAKALKNMATCTADQFTEAFKEGAAAAEKVVGGIGAGLQTVGGNVLESVDEAQKAADKAGQEAQAAVQAATQAADAAVKAAEKALDAAKQAAQAAAAAVAQAEQAAQKAIQQAAQKAADAVKHAAKKIGSALKHF